MDPRAITLIVFVCVFGSAMFGIFLGRVLPDRHIDNEAKDIVKLSTGLIATLSALVLGLLVSSAKGTLDQANNELMQMCVKTVLLDRVLAQYGPETKEIRAGIKSAFIAGTAPLISGDEAQQEKLDSPEGVSRIEIVQSHIRGLTPQNEAQRGLQSRAVQILGELAASRWLLVMQRKGSIQAILLVVLVFWLSVIFSAWGIFSPRNLVVVVALFAASLAVSGAILVILEMDRPLSGWIRVSPAPMQQAIAHLGE